MFKHRIACLAALLALSPQVAAAASYTYTTFSLAGQRIASASGTQNALNDHDQVVGVVEDNSFNFQGFLWQNGNFTLYPASGNLAVIDRLGLAAGYNQNAARGYVTINTRTGRTRTYNNGFDRNPFMAHLYGINANGAVVAQDEYKRTVTAGYIFTGRAKTLIMVPGSDVKYGGTFATSINDAAIVTGYYYSSGNYDHGFIYQAGTYTSFDVPGALGGTFPYVIDNNGMIGGGYATAPVTAQIGFVRSGTQVSTINPPGSTGSYVTGISAAGTIVGTFWDSADVSHGFIYKAGTYYQIDVPGGTRTSINAVNIRGSLVGDYTDANGNSQSFIAQCPQGQICTQ